MRIGVAAFLLGLVVTVMPAIGQAASLNLNPKPLTPYRTCVITGTPSGTSAVIDSEVRQATPSTNYGTQTTVVVSSRSGQNRRTYVRFNLGGCSPSIPSTATVKLARLRLYVTTLPTVCRSLDIFRVTVSWTETGVTWNSQPFGTATNNPASGSRTDVFGVGTPVGCENRVAGYVTGADVTSDVSAFVAGSATNHGWMIRDDAEDSGTTRTEVFSAKNLNNAAQAPQLVVTWTK